MRLTPPLLEGHEASAPRAGALARATGRGSSDQGLDLLPHVLLQVVVAAGVLAGGAGTLPAAEGLEPGPGAGGGSLRPVGVGHTGLDLVEEPFHLFVRAVEAGGQAILHVAGQVPGL